ncbi:hypothetical protein BOS5A_110648 [Bosea sp. EC-HK365B]|nr:hypothetical protein BOSE21B_110063 [Bosea sp. 21B]CAD5283754.1 hypothetical protein BOSE7B_41152 [Bosea sp. 7B]VVT52287.1 hypothetical protein BOS5A_110648 [Bosea sp. EC-HK365B]VXC90249.1 hypothetical protein BOSE127_70197 [Bosea sp. 127]
MGFSGLRFAPPENDAKPQRASVSYCAAFRNSAFDCAVFSPQSITPATRRRALLVTLSHCMRANHVARARATEREQA